MPDASRTVNRLTINAKVKKVNWSIGQLSIVRKAKGFTLVEVLLTLVFSTTLAILLLTAASTLIQTHRSNLQTIAARIATKEIETLRNTSFASLPSSGSISDSDLAKLPSGTGTRTMANYQSSADIKQATVSVYWVQNGLSQSLNLSTLIYRFGI